MGKEWDKDKGGRDAWMAWMAQIMRESLRVIKPGGHALVWSLPRTSHWTGMALEDAGWEVRDCIYSIQGAGFPKSLDVSKAIDKYLQAEREVVGISPYASRRIRPAKETSNPDAQYRMGINTVQTSPATPEAAQWQGFGSALKPAVECWWLCRKPLSEKNIAQNVLTWGCGGINIDACRVGTAQDMNPNDFDDSKRTSPKFSGILNGGKEGQYRSRTGTVPNGRFPSNLLLSHDPRCIARGTKRVRANGPACTTGSASTSNDYGKYQKRSEVSHRDEHGLEEVQAFECHPSCPVRVLGDQAGESKGKSAPRGGTSPNPMSWGEKRKDGDKIAGHEDEGSKARYFTQFHDPLASLDAPFHYFSKSSRRERSLGCEHLSSAPSGAYGEFAGDGRGRQTEHRPAQNNHPTVKPLQLMSWLCRLVGVPGGVILDPFAGSGSTLCAAIQEGFHFIGIEQDAHYCDIARARIAHAQQEARREESEGQEYICVEECPIKVLDAQSGIRKSGLKTAQHADNRNGMFSLPSGNTCYSEQVGGASRFFTQLPPEPVCLWDLLEESGS